MSAGSLPPSSLGWSGLGFTLHTFPHPNLPSFRSPQPSSSTSLPCLGRTALLSTCTYVCGLSLLPSRWKCALQHVCNTPGLNKHLGLRSDSLNSGFSNAGRAFKLTLDSAATDVLPHLEIYCISVALGLSPAKHFKPMLNIS